MARLRPRSFARGQESRAGGSPSGSGAGRTTYPRPLPRETLPRGQRARWQCSGRITTKSQCGAVAGQFPVSTLIRDNSCRRIRPHRALASGNSDSSSIGGGDERSRVIQMSTFDLVKQFDRTPGIEEVLYVRSQATPETPG